jgi:multidrug efflux system outer membrane protein
VPDRSLIARSLSARLLGPAALLGAAPFLGACASSKAEEPDLALRVQELLLPVPEGWAAAATAGAFSSAEGGAPFWTPFGEAELDALVVEALEHNRNIKVSAALLAAAAARSTIARSFRWPTVDATAGVVRSKNIFVGLPIPGSNAPLESLSTTYDVGLVAGWEADLWGRLAAGAAAADAAFAASAADLAAAQLSVAAETSRAWFGAREARLQVELAERTVTSYRDSLRVTEDRFAAGLVGALDVRLARANVATSEALLALSLRGQAVASRRMELVLGRYPAAELDVPGSFGDLPPPVPAGLPAELLARRPDLAALERQLVSAEATIRERRADRWPRVFLTGSAGRTSDEVSDLLDGDFSVWSFAASLAAPLFDGGRRVAAVEEAEANARAAGEFFAGAVLAAFAEVENALDAEGRLRDQIGHLAVAVDEAQAALGLAEAQYREGLVGIDLVLDSQRSLLLNEASLLTSQRELFINRVDLVVALGGGFEAPATSEPNEDTAGAPIEGD